jgi:DNA-directed RNA polymerase specialized sigma24 family protein
MSTAFDVAARNIAAGHVNAGDYDAVRSVLNASVRALGVHDAEEVVQDVLLKFLDPVHAVELDPEKNPGAYLLTAVRWAAVDQRRKEQRERSHVTYDALDSDRFADRGIASAGSPALSDDEAADLLVANENADWVRRVLAACRQNGDQMAYRVVVAILDEIQTTGAMPSQRAVATKLGLSHPTVGKALRRFETYLADDASDQAR